MSIKKGIIASKGMAIGCAYIFEKDKLVIDEEKIESKDIDREVEKIQNSITSYTRQLESTNPNSDTQKEVINAHLEMLNDPFLIDSIKDKISNKLHNAEMALDETIGEMADMLSQLDDKYMQERASDYRDIGERLMYDLKGMEVKNLSKLPKDSIVISRELTPSDTSSMDVDNIVGMAMDLGGETGHTSIIAQTLGIPTLVGMKDISSSVKHGDRLIIDSNLGQVFLNPSGELIKEYEEKIRLQEEKQLAFDEDKFKSAITRDNHQVEVACNMGSIEDLEVGINNGAEGVGLFRTEFLYMDNTDFPSEDEQFQVYKKAALMLDGNPLIIRTLDIGGDKSLPYYKFPKEENPFLGWRAIRFAFDMPDVLNTQIRAILRASAFGKVRFLVPMIISVEEILHFKEILESNKSDLRKENIKFDENIEIGIMIETPSSVIMAEELIKHVDYFSIGTNDLTQYTLAVDRGNETISNLYSNYHPAVLRSIKHVIDISHKAGKWTGMCGGFASDTKATKLLLGMGLDEFSAASSNIPEIKSIIRNTTLKDAEDFANKILAIDKVEKVMKTI